MSEVEMRDVFSGSVDQIGYDEENKELLVVWKRTGKVSAYKGVSPDLAEQTMNAPSIGQALRESIQGTYPHAYR